MSSGFIALRSRSTRSSSRVASVIAAPSFRRTVVAPRTPRTALMTGAPHGERSRAARLAQRTHEVAERRRATIRRRAGDRVERGASDRHAVSDAAECTHMLGRGDPETDDHGDARVPAHGGDEGRDLAAQVLPRTGDAGERDAVDEAAGR